MSYAGGVTIPRSKKPEFCTTRSIMRGRTTFNPKGERLEVRISAEDRSYLMNRAASLGVNVSEIIRRMIDKERFENRGK